MVSACIPHLTKAPFRSQRPMRWEMPRRVCVSVHPLFVSPNVACNYSTPFPSSIRCCVTRPPHRQNICNSPTQTTIATLPSLSLPQASTTPSLDPLDTATTSPVYISHRPNTPSLSTIPTGTNPDVTNGEHLRAESRVMCFKSPCIPLSQKCSAPRSRTSWNLPLEASLLENAKLRLCPPPCMH
jgi:hypothetical protein